MVANQDRDSILMAMVRDFNRLMKDAVDGVNCIDPKVCDGNCCFIQIDVPRVLAEYYIEKQWASRESFQRGDVFSFVIDVDFKKLRCNFFSKQVNGCSLHQTGVKPPQCWVYPTGLDPEDAVEVCKKTEGWRIVQPENVRQAKPIIDQYFLLAKAEAQEENSPKAVCERLNHQLLEKLLEVGPATIGGVRDTWDTFVPLAGDGMCMGTRYFCRQQPSCSQQYFTCPHVCTLVAEKIIAYLTKVLPRYIEKNGFKRDYTFFELQDAEAKQKPSD